MLTKNCKVVLNTIISSEPNLGGRFYTTDFIESKVPIKDFDHAVFRGVLTTLVEERAIRWADNQQTVIALTESGREYKQLNRLESKARWKERIIGFVSGAVVASIPWILTYLIG